jgi:hypothetical protein
MKPHRDGASAALDSESLLHLTDLMLEWCHLHMKPVNDLLVHRSVILSRYRAGERRPDHLFNDLR